MALHQGLVLGGDFISSSTSKNFYFIYDYRLFWFESTWNSGHFTFFDVYIDSIYRKIHSGFEVVVLACQIQCHNQNKRPDNKASFFLFCVADSKFLRVSSSNSISLSLIFLFLRVLFVV